ncbi:MAG: hypothetical protein ACXVXL_29385 [Solirubrobacteraceae bacterium]
MSTRNGLLVRLRSRLDVGEELMGAADAIADMAQRVQLNGPEPNASEKLSHALYKAAEGLALCGVELHEVTEEARRGHGHGLWIREGGAMTLGALRSGDIVLCERRGWRFYAVVVARQERELEVEPIDRRVTYRRIKAREVTGIWRKSRTQNGRVAETASTAS